MSKVILEHHVWILTCSSGISQKPCQNKKRCESSITTIYINRKFQKYLYVIFVIVTEHLSWNLSLLYIKTMNGWMVSFRGTYWFSSACFILLRVCRFSYFSYFYYFFVDPTTSWGIEVSLSILIIEQCTLGNLILGGGQLQFFQIFTTHFHLLASPPLNK